MFMFIYPRSHVRTPVCPHACTTPHPHPRLKHSTLKSNSSTLKFYRAHARTMPSYKARLLYMPSRLLCFEVGGYSTTAMHNKSDPRLRLTTNKSKIYFFDYLSFLTKNNNVLLKLNQMEISIIASAES